jgi:hypothetical protein
MEPFQIVIIILLGIIAWNLKAGFSSIKKQLKDLNKDISKNSKK